MLSDAGVITRRRVARQLVMTTTTLTLWLGCSSLQQAAALQGHRVSSHARLLLPVRATLEAPNADSPSGDGLSDRALAGVVVGSVVAGVVLVVAIGLLIRCLCQQRRRSSISSTQQKPGSASETKTTLRATSVWTFFFRKRDFASGRASTKRVPPPIFMSDKLDPDDISDTSFVLPELGGPNPHNKFDGMEWVDIKGMDDDVLVDISTDLRKYKQQRQQQ